MRRLLVLGLILLFAGASTASDGSRTESREFVGGWLLASSSEPIHAGERHLIVAATGLDGGPAYGAVSLSDAAGDVLDYRFFCGSSGDWAIPEGTVEMKFTFAVLATGCGAVPTGLPYVKYDWTVSR